MASAPIGSYYIPSQLISCHLSVPLHAVQGWTRGCGGGGASLRGLPLCSPSPETPRLQWLGKSEWGGETGEGRCERQRPCLFRPCSHQQISGQTGKLGNAHGWLSAQGLKRVRGKWTQEVTERCPKGSFDNLGLPLSKAACAPGERKRAPRKQGPFLQSMGSPHLPFWCSWQWRPGLGSWDK